MIGCRILDQYKEGLYVHTTLPSRPNYLMSMVSGFDSGFEVWLISGESVCRSFQVEDWDYPNGTFVGTRRGTSGPICDQSSLPSGKIFLNQSMQQIAYEAVQNFLP